MVFLFTITRARALHKLPALFGEQTEMLAEVHSRARFQSARPRLICCNKLLRIVGRAAVIGGDGRLKLVHRVAAVGVHIYDAPRHVEHTVHAGNARAVGSRGIFCFARGRQTLAVPKLLAVLVTAFQRVFVRRRGVVDADDVDRVHQIFVLQHHRSEVAARVLVGGNYLNILIFIRRVLFRMKRVRKVFYPTRVDRFFVEIRRNVVKFQPVCFISRVQRLLEPLVPKLADAVNAFAIFYKSRCTP